MEFLRAHAPEVYLLGINLYAFMLFWADKRRAKTRKRRIRERTLLASCVLGGAPLGYFAMRAFRHKTRDRAFWPVLPLAVFWAGLSVWYVFFSG